MPYEATCPKGHRLQVTEAHFGQRVNCPTCGEAFVVPDKGKTPPPGAMTPPQKPGSDPRRWKPAMEMVADLTQHWLWVGRPLVVMGLILVLFSRGCDAISQRGVERAEAKSQLAQAQFVDEWKSQELELDARLAAMAESKDPKPDPKALAELKAQRAEMAERERKDRKEKEVGEWRTLELNARTAKMNQQINGYWREVFFVFASIVLVLGLLLVSWGAEGAERWITLVMLAIITFSVFIGGTAWGGLKH